MSRNERKKTMYKNIFELTPVFDSRKSFYGKAQVLVDENGAYWLKSYNTIVAKCTNGTYESFGYYSATTSRHQKEFKLQFAK